MHTCKKKKRIKIKAICAFTCLHDQVEFLNFSRWLIASVQQYITSFKKDKRKNPTKLLPSSWCTPALRNNLEQFKKTSPSRQQFTCTKRESSTGMIVHIHQMQHLINTKTTDVGYQQQSNYLIIKKTKTNQRSSMMDPPTTGIKRWWLGHESHLSTKGWSTVFRLICITM